MRTDSVRNTLRSVGAALMLVASLLVSPSIAPAPALAAEKRIAAPSDGYLDQLLVEINGRRAMVGSPPLAYATQNANVAVGQYLADLTPIMIATYTCFHGSNDPVPPGWDYVTASGLHAEVRGEVIGCPMDGYQWTPQQIASSWWDSPAHFDSLYGDPEANVVACGAWGPGRRGFESVACVTLKI